MEEITIGREFNSGKIAQVFCNDKDDLKNIDIKDKSFYFSLIPMGSLPSILAGMNLQRHLLYNQTKKERWYLYEKREI